VISIVLLIMECVLSVVLVFEYFSQNSLGIIRLINGLSISLDAHSSSMNSIKLILDISRCPWRSLATTSCLRITITLSD